jgi:hypothetical protein
MPEISLGQMKKLKADLIEPLVTQILVEPLGNSGRLVSSWLEGALEFTVLKHEVIVLKIKYNTVVSKITVLSAVWPKRKIFIEGAYKVLLFTKPQRKQISALLST